MRVAIEIALCTMFCAISNSSRSQIEDARPPSPFAHISLHPVVSVDISPIAQNTMVCCRTNFSDTRCLSKNVTWSTAKSCNQVGAEGPDGKKTCLPAICGH